MGYHRPLLRRAYSTALTICLAVGGRSQVLSSQLSAKVDRRCAASFPMPCATQRPAALHSTDTDAGSRCGQYQCMECKAWIPTQDRQCHQDYHFACDLSRTIAQQP